MLLKSRNELIARYLFNISESERYAHLSIEDCRMIAEELAYAFEDGYKEGGGSEKMPYKGKSDKDMAQAIIENLNRAMQIR